MSEMSKNTGTGIYAELKFTFEALQRGFVVSRPFVDDRKYDFILEKQGCFNRIQVKSTGTSIAKDGSYKISCAYGSNGLNKYTKKDIDAVAFYVHKMDLFYIIPIEAITSITIRIYPFKEDKRYGAFKNSWHTLM